MAGKDTVKIIMAGKDMVGRELWREKISCHARVRGSGE